MSDFHTVERSVTGRRWLDRAGGDAAVDRLGLAISQRHGLPDVLGRLLASRGVGLDAVPEFLEPTLRTALPNPSILRDMDKAAGVVAEVVQRGETIGILADYDVDGATSAAILIRFLEAVGTPIELHVPDRMKEGYGPNAPALRGLRDRGASVVLTLDCGIMAFEPLAEAARDGVRVVVLDHHVAEPQLPEAVAVVNPNRMDEDGHLGHLAAVGVTFLFLVALNRTLRAAGWYENRPEPNLMQYLDLVALGTVCDVVPLVDLNRALVNQGLKVMAGRRNVGLTALADVARMDSAPDAYQLGFILGPRVNAGGRVGESLLGARLLSSNDTTAAREIATKLDQYNLERREIEKTVLDAAIEQAEAETGDRPVVVVAGEGWHPGVIGIVAGRLRERFNRPACVIALDGLIGKGSGRSVPGVALGPAVIAAQQTGLLLGGGGHAMAAGFTVEREKLDAFRDFLAERVEADLAGQPLVASLNVDGMLSAGGANLALVETLARIGPFGTGNPEPRFVITGAKVVDSAVVGENHVRCILADQAGGRLKGIAFRAMDSELGPALLKRDGLVLHVAGKLKRDDWQGRRGVQLFIDDAAVVG